MPGFSLKILKTEVGNRLISGINALLNRKVVLTRDNEQTSSHQVAGGNSLLTITRRDMVEAIGLNTWAARNVNGPLELPGDLTLTRTGVNVFNPGKGSTPGGLVVRGPTGWAPVVGISVNYNGQWIGADCPPGVAQFRSKSGTSTLCGFSEWNGFASIPPKKYRTLTQGGQYVLQEYNDSGCTSPTGTPTTCNWAGTCTYDSSTCVETQGGTQNCGGGNVTNCGNLGGDFASGSPDTTTTSTNLQAIVTGTCRPGFGHYYKYTTANQYADLTVEDTETDAINRAVGSLGYDSPGQSVAKNSTRGAGVFTFSFTNVEWRAAVSGLVPGDPYIAGVQYGRRVTGSGTGWAEFATDAIPFTAAGGEEFSPWTTIPNESGFETTVISLQICPG